VRFVLAAIAAATLLTPAALASTSPVSPAHARLTGTFQMAGVVTTAKYVKGEWRGEKVKRTWTFTPHCSVGQCGRVTLVRTRGHGAKDTLVLHWRSSDYYTGTGSFYQALRCGSHLWHRGALVPFKITLRITAAAVVNGVKVATTIRATYLNTHRINKTPCVAVLGHDAARYHGQLTQPGPAGEASSGRSPAGS